MVKLIIWENTRNILGSTDICGPYFRMYNCAETVRLQIMNRWEKILFLEVGFDSFIYFI